MQRSFITVCFVPNKSIEIIECLSLLKNYHCFLPSKQKKSAEEEGGRKKFAKETSKVLHVLSFSAVAAHAFCRRIVKKKKTPFLCSTRRERYARN